jgi:hypothetical protein
VSVPHAYLDPTTPVGTNYYVVASVNPNGSTNSSPASAIVTVTTPPQINSPRIVNGAFILSGNGGTPGRLYQVLTSTNVALPLAQWTPRFTNTFDAGGNFAWTNAIAQAGRGFPENIRALNP